MLWWPGKGRVHLARHGGCKTWARGAGTWRNQSSRETQYQSILSLAPSQHWNNGNGNVLFNITHSTHFIYSYMASDIWLRTILIMRKETCCRHIGYSFQLTAMVLLYAPSHRQDSTYHSLCYTSRGALAGTRNKHWNR